MTLRPPVAFVVATAGIAVFSVMDALMKGLVLALGTFPTLLWRGLAGIAISGLLFVAMRGRWPGRAAWRVHLARGVITAGMAAMFFWGLARVPLAQAVALTFVAPLAAIILAALVLHERLVLRQVLASLVALAGVAVILLGQLEGGAGGQGLLGPAAVLASALCYAVNIVLMRRQSLLAGPVEIAFSQSLVMGAAFVLAAPVLDPAPVPLVHAPALVGAAVLATTSLLLLGWAYAHAPASYLATTEYTAFIWSALLGFVVFGERLSPYTLAGAGLIIAGCVLATRLKGAPEPIEAQL